MVRSPTHWLIGTCAVISAAGLIGCRQDEQITQYNIPKAEAIQLPSDKPQTPEGGESTAGRPERMLGAILPGGDRVWFFKLTGPVEPVAEHWDEFKEFVKSVRFQAGGNPDWTAPAEWTRQPGDDIRFATLRISADPPLDITVTALPGGDDPQEQVLANINRWRGQLSLAPIGADALATETETLPTTAGSVATVVNMVGTSKGGGMMGGPFARGGMPTPPPIAPPAAAPVKYEAPAGWSPGKATGMRKAALEVRDGDQKAEITVIDLSREAGDRLANVNRWRGQVGLPPVSADELKASMKSLPVGSLTGDYVELISQEGADAAQSILGVIVDQNDKTWFVKLQGSTPLAVSQREKFEQFVKSLTFE